MVDNRVKIVLSSCGSKLSSPKCFLDPQPGFHRCCFCVRIVISKYVIVVCCLGFRRFSKTSKSCSEVFRAFQKCSEVFRDSKKL